METMVKIDDVEKSVVSFVEFGSNIIITSKNLYMKANWPIDMDHGWRVKVANTFLRALYATYPNT